VSDKGVSSLLLLFSVLCLRHERGIYLLGMKGTLFLFQNLFQASDIDKPLKDVTEKGRRD